MLALRELVSVLVESSGEKDAVESEASEEDSGAGAMDGVELVLIKHSNQGKSDARQESKDQEEIVVSVVNDAVEFLVVGSDVDLLDTKSHDSGEDDEGAVVHVKGEHI